MGYLLYGMRVEPVLRTKIAVLAIPLYSYAPVMSMMITLRGDCA